MSESLLTTADQKEALSIVYVKALAVRAGYVTAQLDFDRDGIDMEIPLVAKCDRRSVYS